MHFSREISFGHLLQIAVFAVAGVWAIASLDKAIAVMDSRLVAVERAVVELRIDIKNK